MNTGIYDQDILRVLQSIDRRLIGLEGDISDIYTRQGEIKTEIQELEENLLEALTDIHTTISNGFNLLAGLLVLATVVKVLFRNA